MNTKVARQIEEMKKQTIGVEVEMNSITREKAAKTAAEYFGTRRYQSPEKRLQRPPQSSSEREDTRTQQAATDTAPGQHGTQTAESGNSRRMSASADRTAKNANL